MISDDIVLKLAEKYTVFGYMIGTLSMVWTLIKIYREYLAALKDKKDLTK